MQVGTKVNLPGGLTGAVTKVFAETAPKGDILVTYIDAQGEKRSRIADPSEVEPA